jgi:hypothetical protein
MDDSDVWWGRGKEKLIEIVLTREIVYKYCFPTCSVVFTSNHLLEKSEGPLWTERHRLFRFSIKIRFVQWEVTEVPKQQP